MLRITLVRESEPPTLKLEGKLSGAWVPELERTWNGFLHEGVTSSVKVDLSDVTFVSADGKALLRSMLQQGTQLKCGSLLTEFILNQIENGCDGKHSTENGG